MDRWCESSEKDQKDEDENDRSSYDSTGREARVLTQKKKGEEKPSCKWVIRAACGLEVCRFLISSSRDSKPEKQTILLIQMFGNGAFLSRDTRVLCCSSLTLFWRC